MQLCYGQSSISYFLMFSYFCLWTAFLNVFHFPMMFLPWNDDSSKKKTITVLSAFHIPHKLFCPIFIYLFYLYIWHFVTLQGTSLTLRLQQKSFYISLFRLSFTVWSTVIALPPILVHSLYLLNWWPPSRISPFSFTHVRSHSYVSKPPQNTALYQLKHSTIYSLCCCTRAKVIVHFHIALSIPSW